MTRVLVALGAMGARAEANSPHPSSREGHLSTMGRTSLYVIRKDRLAALTLGRDQAKTALEQIRAQRSGPTAFESGAIERFGRPYANQLAF